MLQNKCLYRLRLAGQNYKILLPCKICDFDNDKNISLVSSSSVDEITLDIIEYIPGIVFPDGAICYRKNACYIMENQWHFTCYTELNDSGSIGLIELIGKLPITEVLLAHDSMLLHSATVAFDGGSGTKCVSFTAPSGTGKSTQAYLWRDEFSAEVMCEDRTAILTGADGCTASTYPIDSRKTDYFYRCEKLGAIIVLQRGNENRIVRLDTRDAVKQLYFLIIANMTYSETSTLALQVLLRVARSVPVYLQTCCLGKESAYLLRKKLKDDGVL